MVMTMKSLQKHSYLMILVLLGWLQGCATHHVSPIATNQVFANFDNDSALSRYAPIIAPQGTELNHNRVGRAVARRSNNKEEIYIATDQPTFYSREQAFTTTPGNHYQNLIYRFHFPHVPQPRLTAGKNGGLFVILTLNAQRQPVLITTVHTCGCYLAIVPTSYLAATAYPKNWNNNRQHVFGERLPGRLDYPTQFNSEWRPVIHLRSDNHRVMDISLSRQTQLQGSVETVQLRPTSALDHLPLDKGQTSFFHQSGRHNGYVKGAFKPWELLLMSWWTFDLHIGNDKRLADPAETSTVFYTSLKPWARDASNMWFFADFLDYWGWRL